MIVIVSILNLRGLYSSASFVYDKQLCNGTLMMRVNKYHRLYFLIRFLEHWNHEDSSVGCPNDEAWVILGSVDHMVS